jgi:hypothetical protein
LFGTLKRQVAAMRNAAVRYAGAGYDWPDPER